MRKPGRQDLTILVAHNDDPTDQMFVFFPGIVFSRPDFLMWDNYLKNSSDGRVERASVLGAVYLGLIPSRAKPMTLKLVFTASLLGSWHSALKGQCGEKQTLLVVPLGKALSGIPPCWCGKQMAGNS